MTFDILTIFPEAFVSYFGTSILKRAVEQKRVVIRVHGLRRWGLGKHRKLDERPYGGGAGMVLMAEPIFKAIGSIARTSRAKKQKLIILSAKGKPFDQRLASQWAKQYDQLILVSGRYEGIDERVRLALRAEEISLGPYVLTDGDVAAMAIVSAVARLLPGVIKLKSLEEESHFNLLLKREEKKGKGTEYPHYTRPEVLRYGGKIYRVPKVLLSGDHKEIEEWRRRR